jgi:hypothetical protein
VKQSLQGSFSRASARVMKPSLAPGSMTTRVLAFGLKAAVEGLDEAVAHAFCGP